MARGVLQAGARVGGCGRVGPIESEPKCSEQLGYRLHGNDSLFRGMADTNLIEAQFQQIAALLAEAPNLTDFDGSWNLPKDTIRWLGRASAITKAAFPLGFISIQLDQAIDNLVKTYKPEENARTINSLLNRVLASLEFQLPASSQGVFVNAGSSFDAISAFSKVLGEVKKDILIIDPYMDETALTEFAVLIPEGVQIRLLADSGSIKPSLEPMANKWIQQHNALRPLSLRVTDPKALHDRLLLVDQCEAWILTQSLKDFARRSPASLQRTNPETTKMKIDAYETAWAGAKVVCST